MATASNKCSTDQKQELKSLLECSICLEPFDNPRTLPCLHSFCKKCLEKFVKEKRLNELSCPVCRAKFTLNEGGVAGMTKNHFICNMVGVMSIQERGKCITCNYCQEPSVGRCIPCELFMCEACLESHNGYVGFRDHVVLTMEELSKPENRSKIKNISKCNQHPKKKLKYYCETCDELICRHCFDFDHDKQHKFAPLEQAAKSKREDLKANCETLEIAVNKRHKETQDLREVCQSLTYNFNEAQRIINDEKDKLLARLQNKLEKQTNSMIKQVHQVYYQKTELVNTRISDGEAFVNRVKASSDMARTLLQDANDEEIVRSYQSVQENVENVLEEDGDVYDDSDAVMSWSPDKIHVMLVAEIKDIVQEEGLLNVSRAELKPVQRERKKTPPLVSRETKPYSESKAVPQVQNNRDEECLPTGRNLEGDQQNRQRVEVQSTSKSRDKRNPNQPQATSGFSDQNVSPNLGSGQPTNRGTQSKVAPPASLSGNQDFHFSNPFSQTYTTQGRGRARSTSTHPPVSPLHYYSAATLHSGQRQTRSGTRREKQVMPPSTTRDSFWSKGFPNDPLGEEQREATMFEEICTALLTSKKR